MPAWAQQITTNDPSAMGTREGLWRLVGDIQKEPNYVAVLEELATSGVDKETAPIFLEILPLLAARTADSRLLAIARMLHDRFGETYEGLDIVIAGYCADRVAIAVLIDAAFREAPDENGSLWPYDAMRNLTTVVNSKRLSPDVVALIKRRLEQELPSLLDRPSFFVVEAAICGMTSGAFNKEKAVQIVSAVSSRPEHARQDLYLDAMERFSKHLGE